MPPETAIDASDLKREYSRFVGRKLLFLLALVVATVLLAGVSATLGSADLTVAEAYSAVLARFFPNHFHSTWFTETIIWNLRLHRILMALVSGWPSPGRSCRAF